MMKTLEQTMESEPERLSQLELDALRADRATLISDRKHLESELTLRYAEIKRLTRERDEETRLKLIAQNVIKEARKHTSDARTAYVHRCSPLPGIDAALEALNSR